MSASRDDPVVHGTVVRLGDDEYLIVSLPADRTALLTPAERAVHALVLDGSTPLEIAARRGVSRHTVANQVRAIVGKLGYRSRGELVAAALIAKKLVGG